MVYLYFYRYKLIDSLLEVEIWLVFTISWSHLKVKAKAWRCYYIIKTTG